MAIKVVFFAFNPEATFKCHESYLLSAGINIAGYVSCIDQYQQICQQLDPDIICYHDGTIDVAKYSHEFSCKLLAATDDYTDEDQRQTVDLANKKAFTGLNIMGYIENQYDLLLRAFHLLNIGRECFYGPSECPRL